MPERSRVSPLRPAVMNRVEVLVLERDQRAVLMRLGQSGLAQLIDAPRPDGEPLLRRDVRPLLARCHALRERIGRLRQSLLLPAMSAVAPAESLSMDALESELAILERQSAELLEEQGRLTAQRDAARAAAQQAGALVDLGLTAEQVAGSEYLHYAIGTLPEGMGLRWGRSPGATVVTLAVFQGKRRIVAVSRSLGAAEMRAHLGAAGFHEERLPATPDLAVWVQDRSAEAQSADGALREVGQRFASLSANCARNVDALESRVLLELSLLQAESSLGRTESAALLRAWVPETHVPLLEQQVRAITRGHCVVRSTAPEPGREEEVPVLYRHGPWFLPFSLLVSGFGTPQYGEIEPTVFLAGSYVVMFGAMFGDIGHGLLLAAAGLMARRWARSATLRQAGTIGVFLGAASLVFGALYGSCFGMQSWKRLALWRDPIEGDPLSIMLACTGFGAVLISVGIALHVVNRFRMRDRIGAWLDHFGLTGLAFYWGVLALILWYEKLQPGALPIALAALGLPVLAWTLRRPLEWLVERKQSPPGAPGLAAAFGQSIAEAFEAFLIYLASTISFVRLAAYAVSHAALLMAVYMIAGELHSIPALAIGVSMLGNAAVLLLEGTVASVQALRLEYHEFFGKFFSGTGQRFTPFRLPTLSGSSAPSAGADPSLPSAPLPGGAAALSSNR